MEIPKKEMEHSKLVGELEMVKQSSTFVGEATSINAVEGLPVLSQDGLVLGHIILNPVITNATKAAWKSECWFCNKSNDANQLFQPCTCSTLIHRECFRKWRTGWINPRNYFCCPNCLSSYRIERLRPATTASKERILRQYRFGLLKLWVASFVVLGVALGFWAGLTYGSDTKEKNIPVAMKFLLTSVVSGFPNRNSTAQWHEDFKKPDVAVWPYYTIFSLFLTSCSILIAFCFVGCTFDESERKRNRCGPCCDDDCCNNVYCYSCYCYDPCPHTRCNECANCSCCSGGGSCGDFGKCDGNLGYLLVVIVIVVIVAVIFSAIVVVICFAVQKYTLLYDRCTDMLLNQAKELEGETQVLGINESWRPSNAV